MKIEGASENADHLLGHRIAFSSRHHANMSAKRRPPTPNILEVKRGFAEVFIMFFLFLL